PRCANAVRRSQLAAPRDAREPGEQLEHPADLRDARELEAGAPRPLHRLPYTRRQLRGRLVGRKSRLASHTVNLAKCSPESTLVERRCVSPSPGRTDTWSPA